MGSSSTDLLLEFGLAVVAVVLFLLVRARLIRAQRARLIEYTLPLLANAQGTDHRLDAATREAEKGCSICLVCAFENFKSATTCALCGEPIDPHRSGTVTPTSSQGTPPSGAGRLTHRQVRARSRKDWVRKLDVDGNLFWYRANSSNCCLSGVRTNELNAGRVVRFELPPNPEDTVLHKHASDASPESKDAESSDPGQSFERLQAESAKLCVLSAGKADAGARATGETLESTHRKQEAIAMAAKDFPTKYAHFVAQTSSLLVPAEVEFLKLSLHRDFLLEESMEHLSCIEEKYIRSVMRINFLDESGVDAGGLHREWFMLLNELIMHPAMGIFSCTNKVEQAYYLNANSREDNGEDHLIYYYATGRLIGRALLEGNVLDFHLALPLLKLILGMPVSWCDMEYFDPEMYQHLNWLLEHDNVDQLGLDFSVDSNIGGELVAMDLIPNGRNVSVTDANKTQFVQRKFEYALMESVSSQLYVFLTGIYEVIPVQLLMMFDAEELDYLLCGTQEIDADDWEKNSLSSVTLEGTKAEKWFWQIVHEMPNEYKRRLLQFSTGCSRVPVGGFKGLTSYDGRVCLFNLKALPDNEILCIRSHACFNRIDLPFFPSRKELKQNLYAILDTDLYGFTIE